jgi:hypothetical protein
MGVDVVVGGATDGELNEIAHLFEGWDRVFSRFRRASELNRVNGDSAPVLVVSKLFASVVRDALGAASATRGLVDPTLGLAIEAAGYDRDFSLLADDEERPPARRHPGAGGHSDSPGGCSRVLPGSGSTSTAWQRLSPWTPRST